jgi:hypothetical protein
MKVSLVVVVVIFNLLLQSETVTLEREKLSQTFPFASNIQIANLQKYFDTAGISPFEFILDQEDRETSLLTITILADLIWNDIAQKDTEISLTVARGKILYYSLIFFIQNRLFCNYTSWRQVKSAQTKIQSMLSKYEAYITDQECSKYGRVYTNHNCIQVILGEYHDAFINIKKQVTPCPDTD